MLGRVSLSATAVHDEIIGLTLAQDWRKRRSIVFEMNEDTLWCAFLFMGWACPLSQGALLCFHLQAACAGIGVYGAETMLSDTRANLIDPALAVAGWKPIWEKSVPFQWKRE